jgi:hypothetical protein
MSECCDLPSGIVVGVLQFFNGIFANGNELRINEELGQRGATRTPIASSRPAKRAPSLVQVGA